MAADYKLTWLLHPAPPNTPQYFTILGTDALNERVLRMQVGTELVHDDGTPTSELVDYLEATMRAHDRNSQRFLDLLMGNAGLYIKIGQVMAATAQNLPRQYKESLRACMQAAPVLGFEDIRPLLEEELGRPLNEVYEYFDPEPLASASIAQVHKARLRGTGQKVAVKVQHPSLAGDFSADMFAQWACFKVAPRIFKGFDLEWMHEEIENHLAQELDFIHEGQNGEKTAAYFAGNAKIKVPTIYWTCTSSRVLTMEFMEAFPVGDFEAIRRCDISYAAVGKSVIECFAQQIFEHGFVHCDPHLSNVFVEAVDANGKTILPENANASNVRDFRVVLLDHGLYREVEERTRLQYCALWRAMIVRDDVAVEKVCKEMGVGDQWVTMASMVLMRPYIPLTSAMIPMSHAESFTRDQLKDFMKHFSIPVVMSVMKSMPRELVLVLRNQNYVRGLNKELGMPVNRFRLMSRMALGALEDHQAWYRRWFDRLKFECFLFVQDWAWRLGVYIMQWKVSNDPNEVEREMLENMQ
jgi:aarF domain-containing kinase